MQWLYSFIGKRALYSAGAILVVGGVFWMVAARGSNEEENLFTVSVGPLVQEVSASGKVTPARDVELGFTQSGRITSVRAQVGSKVGAGTTLVTIDSGDIQANLLQRQAILESQIAKLAALKAGARPEEIAVAEADVRSKEDALAQSKQAIVDEVEEALGTADDVLRNQIYQFMSNPRSASPRVNFISANTQAVVDIESGVTSAESRLTNWESAVRMLTAAGDVQAAHAMALDNLKFLATLLSRASIALEGATPYPGTTQATVTGYAADIAASKVSVTAQMSSLTSVLTSQKNAAAALDSSQRTLTLKRAGAVQSDIDAQAAQIRAAEADVANVRSQLNKTVISAPFAGIITDVDAKLGAIVSPNTTQVRMIGAGTFQIESFIPEVNIAYIEVGDSARIELDAYGEEEFSARVVSIDPAETVSDGVSTYRVLLQFDTNDTRIRSGMTANIMVKTDERADVLSVPRGVISERDGKKYLTVKKGEDTEEREVTTGIVSSTGFVEVLSGLQAGEKVVLEPGA